MVKRCLGIAAMALFVVSFARASAAGVITFDQPIGGSTVADDPGDDADNCVVYCGYDVFTTQGFTFTALANPGLGDHGEGVVVNSGAIPGLADNGTDYLLAGGIVLITRTDHATFSLFSIEAANIFPEEDDVANLLRIVGLKNNVPFQFFELDVNAAFQQFDLPDTWTGLSGVRISGRLAGNLASPRIIAVDNLAVPEPSSLLLFGSGALALCARARRRRTVRP